MRWLALALALWLSVGCSSDKVQVQVGFVTDEVRGQISPTGEPGPLVLVRAHRAGFVKTSKGRLAQINAFLVFPDAQGVYSVPLASEVRAVDLLVFRPGYRPARASFERSLGVQAYEFDVKLKTDKDWRNGYFMGLKPVLSGYITERRYSLPPKDVLYLNDWMDRVEEDLAKSRQP